MIVVLLLGAMVGFWFSGCCTAMYAYGIKTKKGNNGGRAAITWACVGCVWLGTAAWLEWMR